MLWQILLPWQTLRPWAWTATSPMWHRESQWLNVLQFFVHNSLVHHHMWVQKYSTLPISESTKMSKQPWTPTLKKDLQITTVRSSACNIYLEKENSLELFHFTTLLLKAGAVKWHFTVTVKSLHVAGGAQQHTLRPSRDGDGDISSSLLLPSTVGVKGGLQRGTVSHWWPPGGNHDTETHPPPQESLLGLAGCPCAGDHPEWPPPTSGPEHPTAPATHSDHEDQTMPLTVLGNLALNFSREKESWGRCMTSLGEFSCRIEITWKHPRHPEEMTANYG